MEDPNDIARVERMRKWAAYWLGGSDKGKDAAKADIDAICAQVERDQARIAELEAWDNPTMDATDYAHPAWWRGQDHTTAVFCREATKILDGNAPTGTSHEPWETLRRRLWALCEKYDALAADYRDTVTCLNHERLRSGELREAAWKEGFKSAISKTEPQREAMSAALRMLRDAVDELAPAGGVPSHDVGPPNYIQDAEDIIAGIQEIEQDAKLEGQQEGIASCVTAMTDLAAGLRDRAETTVRALAAKPPQPEPQYRHNVRGTTYTIVGKGRVQCPADAPLRDDEEALIYRYVDTGHYAIRREAEFFDGRFELVPPQATPEG